MLDRDSESRHKSQTSVAIKYVSSVQCSSSMGVCSGLACRCAAALLCNAKFIRVTIERVYIGAESADGQRTVRGRSEDGQRTVGDAGAPAAHGPPLAEIVTLVIHMPKVVAHFRYKILIYLSLN